jgi:CDP-diacylglycerol--inositol 3-phosphatidyltransferase
MFLYSSILCYVKFTQPFQNPQGVTEIVSLSVSAFDGYFARRLQQTSAFGAWLDVMADNIGRTMLWTSVVTWGWMVACLEWTVFVCTHQMGARWKDEFASAPKWAKRVMENGFYTPVGVFTIAGIHGLPIALYYWNVPFSWFLPPEWTCWTIVIILSVGRFLGGAVELWVVCKHMQHLVKETNLKKE